MLFVPAALRRYDIVVVTGSIALGDTPRAGAWAFSTMLAGFVTSAPYLLVHGDASGADHAAERAASEAAIPSLVFPSDKGRAMARWRMGLFDPPPERVCGDPRPDIASVLPEYDGHPLRRNDAMIAWAKVRRDAGARVLVVALAAPWCERYAAGRGGTRYTAHMAEKAGLPVKWFVCPEEYAGKE
jgi:hypothetical protein